MHQRIRTFKPELLKHEGLFEAEQASGLPIRLAWLGLFTVCDREGRFKWRPRTLKAVCLPYDDIDFGQVLDILASGRFVVRYRCGDEWYGWIPTFTSHQVINNREQASTLPAIEEAEEVQQLDASGTRERRVKHASRTEQNRTEQNGMELNADSAATLRVTTPAVLTFPTIGKGPKTWGLTQEQIADWQSAYPGIDVLGECRKALVWVNANQAKTAAGMAKFLVNWLNRAVSRGVHGRPQHAGPVIRSTASRSVTSRGLAGGGQ